MGKGYRSFGMVWLLFGALGVLAVLLVCTIGSFQVCRDYRRSRIEADGLRREYIANQEQAIKKEVEEAIDYIRYSQSKLEARLRDSLREHACEAYNLANRVYAFYCGKIPDKEIRALVVEALRPIRFNNGRGSYFALGLDGRQILSPDHPEMEGRFLLDAQDPRGAFVIRGMMELARGVGEGFYEYEWPKPTDQGKDHHQIAFIKFFAPLDCLLGTCEYLDDMEADIQREILERIGKIRVGQDGYIFVVSYDGVTLMNGVQPELIGRNMWEMTDPHGVKIVQEERRVAEKPGGGFIRYSWKQPTKGQLCSKVSFVEGFPEWRWMVGAGFYSDDVEAVITGRESEIRRWMRSDLAGLGLTLAGSLLGALLLSCFLARYFGRQLGPFVAFFQDMESGGTSMSTERIRLQEFRSLGESANRMLEKRRQAEEVLKREQERFRILVEKSPLGVALIGGDGSYRYVNSQFVEIFGYRLPDIPTGKVWFEKAFPDPEYRREAVSAWLSDRHKYQKGEVRPRTYQVTCRDGREKMICFRPVLLETGDELVIYEDLTERMRLEAQLLQAGKMEAVGRLAGGVAHDFNNMLQTILGYAEMALEQAGPGNPLRGNLEEIRKAGRRSADLTRQLLAFARKQTIVPRILDLNDTIADMLKMLRPLIGESIGLLWKPGARIGRVKMDPSQLDQILANLVINARDAIAGVGRVTIETADAALDEDFCRAHPGSHPGRQVVLTVSDDGCGMDKPTLAKLFEPFFTTKEQGRGTGLGLAMVYGIVKQNNGFIDVQSAPGKGTVFNLYFPSCAEERPADKKTALSANLPMGTETVLLVEDEAALVRLARILLERLGYRVLAAESPAAAIRLAKEHAGMIDLLLTDVVMPEMSGRELCETLVASTPGLKCLYMSGYPADVIAEHAELEEGTHFIQKPFTLEVLAVKLREALGH